MQKPTTPDTMDALQQAGVVCDEKLVPLCPECHEKVQEATRQKAASRLVLAKPGVMK